MKHVAIALLLFFVWFAWSTALSTFEPVISTDIAVRQMDDTTEGHAAMRAYTSRTQRFLYGPLIPGGVTILVLVVGYGKTVKKSFEGRT